MVVIDSDMKGTVSHGLWAVEWAKLRLPKDNQSAACGKDALKPRDRPANSMPQALLEAISVRSFPTVLGRSRLPLARSRVDGISAE